MASIEKFNSNNSQSNNTTSDSKLFDFLQAEVNKRKDLKVVKEKLDQISEKDEYNMIYKLKMEKSKGDSLFSSVNDSYGKIGSSLGVRTSTYLDHYRRFEQSKSLVSEAATYQRNQIKHFTDGLFKHVWRHRFNYLAKAGLASIFLYNLCKATENKNLYLLRKVHPSKIDVAKIYYNSAVSFGFAFLAFTLF